MSKLSNYIKETRAEFTHVNWPSRSQTIAFTILVVAISAIVAYMLGLFDFIFSQGLQKLLHL